jgi:hypothetical protein
VVGEEQGEDPPRTLQPLPSSVFREINSSPFLLLLVGYHVGFENALSKPKVLEVY